MKPAADHDRLVGLQLARSKRLADHLEEMALALGCALQGFRRCVRREPGGAAEGGHLATVCLWVVAVRVFEERVPRLVPRFEAGGRGELAVEPARSEEPVVVRSGGRAS